MFIGFYSVANTVTMFGLVSAITACFLAANGNYKFAVYMMFLACLCDMFDGRIARSTPNRTSEQKFYGVQLDSLCDVISFGLTPCFIAFSFGFDGVIDVIIYCLFIVCGAIRLAYFNTLANENPGKKMKTYRGIPIPVSTFLTTFLFMLTTFIPATVTVWLFRVGFLLMALGFILNIKIKKPDMRRGIAYCLIELILLAVLLIAGDCKTPAEQVTDGDSDIPTEETSGEVSE